MAGRSEISIRASLWGVLRNVKGSAVHYAAMFPLLNPVDISVTLIAVVTGIEVRYLDLVDISPPGRGDETVPATVLRVPSALKMKVTPVGEALEYTPVALRL